MQAHACSRAHPSQAEELTEAFSPYGSIQGVKVVREKGGEQGWDGAPGGGAG